MHQAFFLVFDRYYGSFSLGNFSCKLFDFLIEVFSFSGKFLWLVIILLAALFLQVIVAIFKLRKISVLIFNLLLHHLIFPLKLIENVSQLSLRCLLVVLKSIIGILMIICHFGDPFLVVFNSLIHFLFASFLFSGDSSLKPILFFFMESLDLSELLFRFRVVLLNKLLDFSVLFFKLLLQLMFSLLQSIFRLLEQISFVGFKVLQLFNSFFFLFLWLHQLFFKWCHFFNILAVAYLFGKLVFIILFL